MQIATDSKPISSTIQSTMERYRAELLEFGMQEPSKRKSSVWHWCFFKPMTELTAFIVNLRGMDNCIEVAYGYASTAFTRFSGAENELIELGVSDENITVREKCIIYNAEDEQTARLLIADMYNRYVQIQKDDLLVFSKEKRKAFIQQIVVKLRPLGFKKKANIWTRTLEGEYYLMFGAQKSSFSDEYYFNICIGKDGLSDRGACYYTRIAPEGMYAIDWQALKREKFEVFLDNTVVPELEKIIHTPLNKLGKIPSYWAGCHCDHKKCGCCWMEKNLWEAQKIEKHK